MFQVSLPKPSISTTATSAVNAAQITEVKSSFVAAATDNESPKDDLILNEKNQGLYLSSESAFLYSGFHPLARKVLKI